MRPVGTAPTSVDFTDLLRAWRSGDGRDEARLLRHIYPCLHELARRQLAREGHHPSLQVTDLLHDAYERLVDVRKTDWRDRGHFFATASKVIRHVLVDHARRRRSRKRGGDVDIVSLESQRSGAEGAETIDVLRLDVSLSRLYEHDAQAARLVELRYFGGLSIEETAKCMGIGRTSAVLIWRHARSWLRRDLKAYQSA